MRCVYPPGNGEKDRPNCGEDVVNEEEMGEVECVLGILLRSDASVK